MSTHQNEALRNIGRIANSGIVPESQSYNLARVIESLGDGSFRKTLSPELRAVQEFEEMVGAPTGNPNFAIKLPPQFLPAPSQQRLLNIGAAASGGNVSGTSYGKYLPALQAFDPIVARATSYPIDPSQAHAIPRGTGPIPFTWQPSEGTTSPDQTPTIGMANSSLHTAIGHVRLSRQLIKQSNASAIIARELASSGAAALGTAIRQGTGTAGQPTGVLNTPNIGTASGASLAYAALVAAMVAVANANAVDDSSRLAWVTTPDVAGLLKQRYRIATYGETPLWQGGIPAGEIEGAAAYATKQMAAASAVYGDWSKVYLVEYPTGALLEVDPYTGFQSGIYGMRLTLYVDVLVAFPGSFYSLTAIS